jgi:hypothetical protein
VPGQRNASWDSKRAAETQLDTTCILKARHRNLSCSGGDEVLTRIFDSPGYVSTGQWNSLSLGTGGFPVVSLYDPSNKALRVAVAVQTCVFLSSKAVGLELDLPDQGWVEMPLRANLGKRGLSSADLSTNGSRSSSETLKIQSLPARARLEKSGGWGRSYSSLTPVEIEILKPSGSMMARSLAPHG